MLSLVTLASVGEVRVASITIVAFAYVAGDLVAVGVVARGWWLGRCCSCCGTPWCPNRR
jgi:hypothetical protein